MSNSRIDRPERFAKVFKALSNGNRLKIFSRLAFCCTGEDSCCIDSSASACVGEIAQELDLAPSTVSHHIKELHHSGLIEMERQGQSVHCWVVPEAVREIEAFFHNLAHPESLMGERENGTALSVGENT